MVRAPDLKSGGCGFNSRSDRFTGVRPEFVHSQLVYLLPVGVFNLVVFDLNYLFLKFNCSAPLFGDKQRHRVNKGYLFIFF